jgi:magnesium transporter
VPTALAGVYGMNFENMPELKWTYGYFLVLGFLLIVCGTLFWQFRHRGWI